MILVIVDVDYVEYLQALHKDFYLKNMVIKIQKT